MTTTGNGKLILITGGAGYVGSALVRLLLARGYRVRVLDSLLFGTGGIDELTGRIELVRGDALRPPARVMDGVHGVIHLAGVSSQAKASYWSPRYTDLMNHLSTQVLGQAAKAAGVERFVLASSCSIYCQYKATPAAEPPFYDETDHVDIFGPYALSKRAAEEALFGMMDERFRPTSLRKGTVFGFSPKMRYDLVLNAFTKDAFTKRRISVNAGGEIYRPMVDIQDALRAYVGALELPIEDVGGEVFNVVGRNVKIGDLAAEFQRTLAEAKGVDVEIQMRPFEATLSYMASSEKYERVFGLAPLREPSGAILELWEQLEAGHDHQDPRYYNDGWYAHLAEQGLLTTG